MTARSRQGRAAEELAAAFLTRRGYTVISRNYRCPRGEIDIVARKDGLLCIVEVRSRATAAFGHPVETVTPAKQRRVALAAAAYLAEHGQEDQPIRFDVVGIVEKPRRQLTHIEAAFEPDLSLEETGL